MYSTKWLTRGAAACDIFRQEREEMIDHKRIQ